MQTTHHPIFFTPLKSEKFSILQLAPSSLTSIMFICYVITARLTMRWLWLPRLIGGWIAGKAYTYEIKLRSAKERAKNILHGRIPSPRRENIFSYGRLG
jgi:hypothetical protein